MITEDLMRQICVPLEKSAYFGDGDGVDLNPVYSTIGTVKDDKYIKIY